MGHKDKLKSGLEWDAISKWGRRFLCYLNNNSKLKSFAKNQINRRNRYQNKKQNKKYIQCTICEGFDCDDGICYYPFDEA